MSNKAARNLFLFGSLFFFVIFLGLTYDTLGKLDKRAPVITEEVNAGKMVWQIRLHRLSYHLRQRVVLCT
jgi:nitric oxide reductase subunit C